MLSTLRSNVGISLSQSGCSVFQNRKRPNNILNHKQALKKYKHQNRITREDIENETVKLPSRDRICKCEKTGCKLPYEDRLKMFKDFHEPDSSQHNAQSAYLNAIMQKSSPKQRTTEKGVNSRRSSTWMYSLIDSCNNNQPTCYKMILDTLGVTPNRIQYLQYKRKNGDIKQKDMRGTHKNRPHKVKPEEEQFVLDHINSFPTYISHYTRQTGNPERKYLDPSLSISKLHELYMEKVPSGDRVLALTTFKYIYYKTGLSIGTPMTDTCDLCDRLTLKIKSLRPGNTREIQKAIKELESHQEKAEKAYASLKADTLLSQTKPDEHVTLSVDMMNVMLSPQLQNSDNFYRRKVSSYCEAITNPATEESWMYCWEETDGNRGEAEISSILFKHLTSHYDKLGENQKRNLSIYSDRCCGKNNNFLNVALFKFLVTEGYFTEISQKFLVTGHSFLPCDRHFATIEKCRKGKIIYCPSDWLEIIRSARKKNPFRVVKLQRSDFVNLEALKCLIPLPASLQVTKFQLIQINADAPAVIYTKTDYSTKAQWIRHDIFAPFNEGLSKKSRLEWNPDILGGWNFEQKYPKMIPLKPKKIKDLESLLRFIPAEKRTYLELLVRESRIENEAIEKEEKAKEKQDTAKTKEKEKVKEKKDKDNKVKEKTVKEKKVKDKDNKVKEKNVKEKKVKDNKVKEKKLKEKKVKDKDNKVKEKNVKEKKVKEKKVKETKMKEKQNMVKEKKRGKRAYAETQEQCFKKQKMGEELGEKANEKKNGKSKRDQ